MSIDFSQVTAITIPEGSVSQITDSSSNVLWSVGSGPSYGRYVLVFNTDPNTSNPQYQVYDTINETLVTSGTLQSNYLQQTGSYKWALQRQNLNSFIQQNIKYSVLQDYTPVDYGDYLITYFQWNRSSASSGSQAQYRPLYIYIYDRSTSETYFADQVTGSTPSGATSGSLFGDDPLSLPTTSMTDIGFEGYTSSTMATVNNKWSIIGISINIFFN